MNKDNFEIYKDRSSRFRWRRVARNGEIVGASTQGYKNKDDAVSNMIRNGFDKKVHALKDDS